MQFKSNLIPKQPRRLPVSGERLIFFQLFTREYTFVYNEQEYYFNHGGAARL